MVKGGLRKKFRRVHKNTVKEDHREGLVNRIKYMRLLIFKVPILMVIHRLVCVAKGGQLLVDGNF